MEYWRTMKLHHGYSFIGGSRFTVIFRYFKLLKLELQTKRFLYPSFQCEKRPKLHMIVLPTRY